MTGRGGGEGRGQEGEGSLSPAHGGGWAAPCGRAGQLGALSISRPPGRGGQLPGCSTGRPTGSARSGALPGDSVSSCGLPARGLSAPKARSGLPGPEALTGSLPQPTPVGPTDPPRRGHGAGALGGSACRLAGPGILLEANVPVTLSHQVHATHRFHASRSASAGRGRPPAPSGAASSEAGPALATPTPGPRAGPAPWSPAGLTRESAGCGHAGGGGCQRARPHPRAQGLP